MTEFAQFSSLRPHSSIAEGEWVYIHPHQDIGKVIERSDLWGNTSFRVWLPSADSIIRVPESQLSSTQSSVLSPHHLSYIAAAARVADALTQDVLLAPIESSVTPLPHQARAFAPHYHSGRKLGVMSDED